MYHLSNTTCVTQVFLRSHEYAWQSVAILDTINNAQHKTHEALLDT